MKKETIKFTLIELLVVIAIISILASMLLPALKHARGVAQFTDCKTNIRTITQAIHLYTDENNGYVPNLKSDVANGYTYYWNYLLVPYVYPNTPVEAAQIKRKYQFPVFWNCGPVNDKRNFEYESQIAYGMNRVIYSTFDGENRPFKIARMPRSSEIIALGDSAATYDGSGTHNDRAYYICYFQGQGYPHFRHVNKRAGISFFDGHVDSFVEKDICGTYIGHPIMYDYWTFKK